MGPTWVLSAPDGPHIGPMNLALREWSSIVCQSSFKLEAFWQEFWQTFLLSNWLKRLYIHQNSMDLCNLKISDFIIRTLWFLFILNLIMWKFRDTKQHEVKLNPSLGQSVVLIASMTDCNTLEISLVIVSSAEAINGYCTIVLSFQANHIQWWCAQGAGMKHNCVWTTDTIGDKNTSPMAPFTYMG